jgi:hypothetical protein
MNLALVYKLLLATTQQRHGFLKLADPWADDDVQQMVEAGLVKATLRKTGGFTSINEVTVAGHAFLRIFAGHSFLSVSNSRMEKGSYWRALAA